MNFIETAEGAFRYDLSGNGPSTLVLIHELGGALESWDGLVPLLGGDTRVLRYDLRGAGMSQKARGSLDLQQMARDLASLLDALNIGERVCVAGCAAGAAVALAFAARYPQRVGAVVAMAPATGGASPEAALRGSARADQVEQHGMRANVDSAMDGAYPASLRTDASRFAAYRARWLGNDPGGYAAIFRMLLTMDVTPLLPAITCPVLVLAGTLDPNRTPEQIRQKLQGLADVRFAVLESGHFMPVATPELVADAMRPFVLERATHTAAQPARGAVPS